ncbi:MAG: NAD(P)H-dependent glycerol-3-phosphate dehydrogenase [Kistimonas sp.]|nr:NAD(P)H-dependent glycerol-3-phosphate dehydrogenase [Kistimonas sp.]
MIEKRAVTVVGGGSFGTVLADLAARRGHSVRWWMRCAQQASAIRETGINSRYLPQRPVSDGVTPTTDLEWAVRGSDLVFMAVPSQSFRGVASRLGAYVGAAMVVSTAKGIEANGFHLMSDILAGELPGSRTGVLSGPNLAREVMDGHMTATVVASEHSEVCRSVQEVLRSHSFHVYSSTDYRGVELGGALKNIYAIAVGLASALELGDNTRSALVTRSLSEMTRFAVTLGADPVTFLGLAGVGDLIVTCGSRLSRNFRVGYALGEGKNLEQIGQELGQVAEGLDTLVLVRNKALQLGVSMPIVEGLYAVVVGGGSVRNVADVMAIWEQKADTELSLPTGGECLVPRQSIQEV